MARRKAPRRETPPVAERQPVASSLAGQGTEAVLIRAGHRHRGVDYDGATLCSATPEEIALLRRYDAIVES